MNTDNSICFAKKEHARGILESGGYQSHIIDGWEIWFHRSGSRACIKQSKNHYVVTFVKSGGQFLKEDMIDVTS